MQIKMKEVNLKDIIGDIEIATGLMNKKMNLMLLILDLEEDLKIIKIINK